MSNPTPQLGYFLKYCYWQNACKLLEYQLSLKAKNKHFNILSMFYYERINKQDKNRLQDKIYFNQRVSNNLLYGLRKEFAIYSYPIPKSNLGLRKYSFFTYPMRIAWYAVGLYLAKLSQEIVQQYYRKQSHIHSYYGGDLRFDDKTGDLCLSYKSVWYKPHYRRFRSKVRSEVQSDVQDKIVIHIDIQNYFEEISIPTLLDFLSEYVKPSIQREMSFDLTAKRQIVAFFDFIVSGRIGIPQADNDILSSFIGHLYLIFSDLLLDQEICKDSAVVKEHSIVRYMDDMYIVVSFHNQTARTDREIYISDLAARIADILYRKLGLRLNTKTRLYWLSRDNDKRDLLKNLKRVSSGYEMPDYDEDDKKTGPQDKVESIFRQLENLKKRALDPTFDERSDLDDEILKEVYDKSVSNLLRSRRNLERIKKIFDEFNFELVMAQPREILIVLLADHDAPQRFSEFLLKKKELSS